MDISTDTVVLSCTSAADTECVTNTESSKAKAKAASTAVDVAASTTPNDSQLISNELSSLQIRKETNCENAATPLLSTPTTTATASTTVIRPQQQQRLPSISTIPTTSIIPKQKQNQQYQYRQQQQITVTTTMKSMSRYKHILQPQQHSVVASSTATTVPTAKNTSTSVTTVQVQQSSSFALVASTTLLLGITTEYWIESANVYLIDLSYMINWLIWCIHPSSNHNTNANTGTTTSNVANHHDHQRLQECVRTIALQYQLPIVPAIGMSYTNPGPIDNRHVSYSETMPLLLFHHDDIHTNANNNNNNKSNSENNHNNNGDDMDTTTITDDHYYLQVYQPCVDPYAATSAIMVATTSSSGNYHQNQTTTISSSSTNGASTRSLPNYGDRRPHQQQQQQPPPTNGNHTTVTTNGNHSNVRSCMAVPESFYELLRSVHGVLCDDYHTVAFQPYVSPIFSNLSNGYPTTGSRNGSSSNNNRTTMFDGEDIVLHCHLYKGNNDTDHDDQSQVPRPIEFRRKIIYQVGVVGTLSSTTTKETTTTASSKQQIQPIRPKLTTTQATTTATSKKKSLVPLQQQQSTTSLMDKLLSEQQIEQKYLMVEVHPMTLYYSYYDDDDDNKDGNVKSGQDKGKNSSKHFGAVVVNGNGNAMDDTVRISNGQVAVNTTTTEGMTTSNGGGGGSSSSSNKQQNQPARQKRCGFLLMSRETPAIHALNALQQITASHKVRQCVRLWSQWTYNNSQHNKLKSFRNPTSTYDEYELIDMEQLAEEKIVPLQHQLAIDNGQALPILVTLGSYVQRHHITPNSSELDVLIETRRTVNTSWPRTRYELSCRIQPGDYVDAQDVTGHWYEAIVREVYDNDDTNNTVLVHYTGWASKWDTKVRRRNIQENSDTVDSSLEMPPLSPSITTRVKAPAPLWSQSGRWRERIRVGDVVEVRDSSSLVERPKWYKGIVQHVSGTNEKPRTLSGGADIELYGAIVDPINPNNTVEGRPLLLLNRTQQILVEVEQERTAKSGNNNNVQSLSSASSVSDSLAPHPPYIRWVNLFGEEICKLGTHLKEAKDEKPVTLRYEYDTHRKPVAVMKSHPTLGSGFLRESLRGTPPAPGSVGLHNLGNSCFLNSTVQCLNHISYLTQFFVQDKYSEDLNQRNPLGSGGNVAVAYASLLKKIWAGEHSVLVPRMLKQTVANFAPQFDNSYQHDSHEFCQFLMDGLHEDLNRVKTKPYVEELEGFGMDDDKAAIESWKKHVLRHDSVIVDHCQGMHRSHLTCPQCGRESIKFDVYSSISLPLPTDKNRGTIMLEDCIEKFMEAEQLDERDAYYCPNCRRHVCALKLIALWTVPDVLILHLKRFTFDTCMSSGSMLRSKVDNKVEFPINQLDLSKIVLGPKDPSAPPIFNLFGVSEHIGATANSGHYTATVRNSVDGQWYRCNDSQVGLTSGEASITGGAYLLFYQRAKGSTRWGGMHRAMKELNIDPYGIPEPIDKEGYRQVKLKKKKK